MRTFICLEGHLIEPEQVVSLVPHYDPETGKGTFYEVTVSGQAPFRLKYRNGLDLEKKVKVK